MLLGLLVAIIISKLFKFIVHVNQNNRNKEKFNISKLFKFTVHKFNDTGINRELAFQNFSSLQFIKDLKLSDRTYH